MLGNQRTPRLSRCVAASLCASSPIHAAGPEPLIEWLNPESSFWEFAGNWSTGTIPGENDTAVIAIPGVYEIAPLSDVVVAELRLTNPLATLRLFAWNELQVGNDAPHSATLTNDGIIRVNSGNPGLTQLIVGSPTQPGRVQPGPGSSGVIRLDRSDNVPTFDATFTMPWGGVHDAGHTILGNGKIEGTFENRGLVTADEPQSLVRVRAEITQTGDGRIEARNGGSVLVETGATIDGGRIEELPGGEIVLTSDLVRLQGGVRLVGDITSEAQTLEVGEGGFITENTLRIGSEDGVAIELLEGATLLGGGTIELASGSGNFSEAPRFHSLAETPAVIGPDLTITGSGRLHGDYINHGTLRVGASDRFEIWDNLTQSDSGRIIVEPGGTFGFSSTNLSGGTITAEPGQPLILGITLSTGGGIIVEGTYRFLHPHSSYIFHVRNNETTVLNGTIWGADYDEVDRNNGTVSLGFGSTLAGTGTLDRIRVIKNNGSPMARIEPTVRITNPDVVIGDFRLPGGLTVDARDSSISGTFDFEGTGEVLVSNGHHISVGGPTFRNGTLRATNGAYFEKTGKSFFESITIAENTTIRFIQGNGGGIKLNEAGITNSGTIVVRPDYEPSRLPTLIAYEDSTIAGTGEIHLTTGADDPTIPPGIGSAPDATLTLGPGQLIKGKGYAEGVVRIDGTLSPGFDTGDIASFTVQQRSTNDQSSRLILGPDATLVIDLADGASDAIHAETPVEIAGVLRLRPPTNGTPGPTEQFRILDADRIEGQFSHIESEPPPPEGFITRAFYSDTTVTIAITCPADFALPAGVLDAADIEAFMSRFLQSDPEVDLALPEDVIDLMDIVAFINGYLAGCD